MTATPSETATVFSLRNKDGETLFADTDIRKVNRKAMKLATETVPVALWKTEQVSCFVTNIWGEG